MPQNWTEQETLQQIRMKMYKSVGAWMLQLLEIDHPSSLVRKQCICLQIQLSKDFH